MFVFLRLYDREIYLLNQKYMQLTENIGEKKTANGVLHF